MASELVINGNHDDAFTHLLLVGLASILDDADETLDCRIRWKGFDQAAISVSKDSFDWLDCARIVHDHAERWSISTWLNATGVYATDAAAGAASKATLSPRLGKFPTRAAWQRLQDDRQAAIDGLQTALDHRYVGALGEPSYWCGSSDDQDPDRGATRWEMVTRNKGKEFIGGRLLPLAKAVAARSIKQVEEGLCDVRVTDEVGENKPNSRTSTGLHQPSATDNARAWCALIGVSMFPIARSTQARKESTAAFFPMKGQREPYAILPLWAKPWTLAKYRAVVRSRALLTVGLDARLQPDAVERKTASINATSVQRGRRWLTDQGVTACMVFRQYVSNNKSAPERWLEKGDLLLLTEPGINHGR